MSNEWCTTRAPTIAALQCYHWVRAWRPDLDMAEYAAVGRALVTQVTAQPDWPATVCPTVLCFAFVCMRTSGLGCCPYNATAISS